MSVKIYQHFPFLGSQKFTQIGIFGLKIYHLATLHPTPTQKRIETILAAPFITFDDFFGKSFIYIIIQYM
jgi:hypothetical protein